MHFRPFVIFKMNHWYLIRYWNTHVEVLYTIGVHLCHVFCPFCGQMFYLCVVQNCKVHRLKLTVLLNTLSKHHGACVFNFSQRILKVFEI